MTEVATLTLAEFGSAQLPQRFWTKVREDGECWLWVGGLNRNGYGRFMRSSDQRTVVAHRVAYEALIGPIPVGLQLDHLCRVRRCVNPAHVEPVTQKENLARGATITAAASAATHCPAGHPYHGGNLYVTPKGERRCRACHRDRQAARRAVDLEVSRRISREANRRYRDRHQPDRVRRPERSHPDFRPEWRP